MSGESLLDFSGLEAVRQSFRAWRHEQRIEVSASVLEIAEAWRQKLLQHPLNELGALLSSDELLVVTLALSAGWERVLIQEKEPCPGLKSLWTWEGWAELGWDARRAQKTVILETQDFQEFFSALLQTNQEVVKTWLLPLLPSWMSTDTEPQEAGRLLIEALPPSRLQECLQLFGRCSALDPQRLELFEEDPQDHWIATQIFWRLLQAGLLSSPGEEWMGFCSTGRIYLSRAACVNVRRSFGSLAELKVFDTYLHQLLRWTPEPETRDDLHSARLSLVHQEVQMMSQAALESCSWVEVSNRSQAPEPQKSPTYELSLDLDEDWILEVPDRGWLRMEQRVEAQLQARFLCHREPSDYYCDMVEMTLSLADSRGTLWKLAYWLSMDEILPYLFKGRRSWFHKLTSQEQESFEERWLVRNMLQSDDGRDRGIVRVGSNEFRVYFKHYSHCVHLAWDLDPDFFQPRLLVLFPELRSDPFDFEAPFVAFVPLLEFLSSIRKCQFFTVSGGERKSVSDFPHFNPLIEQLAGDGKPQETVRFLSLETAPPASGPEVPEDSRPRGYPERSGQSLTLTFPEDWSGGDMELWSLSVPGFGLLDLEGRQALVEIRVTLLEAALFKGVGTTLEMLVADEKGRTWSLSFWFHSICLALWWVESIPHCFLESLTPAESNWLEQQRLLEDLAVDTFAWPGFRTELVIKERVFPVASYQQTGRLELSLGEHPVHQSPELWLVTRGMVDSGNHAIPPFLSRIPLFQFLAKLQPGYSSVEVTSPSSIGCVGFPRSNPTVRLLPEQRKPNPKVRFTPFGWVTEADLARF